MAVTLRKPDKAVNWPDVANHDDRFAALTARVAELEAKLEARITRIEARLPARKPRFEIPDAWVRVGDGADLCGFSPITVYEWWRRGKIAGVKHGGRVFVDPNTLPLARGNFRHYRRNFKALST